MNFHFAYLVLPIIVGLVIGASVFFVQQVNLTGYMVSPVSSESGNETPQQNLAENETKCPASCDDGNPCSTDWCNETSNYLCSYTPINGTSGECWGNPTTCSTNSCVSGKCVETLLTNCCGNNVCESSESCNSCAADCSVCPPQVIPTQPTQTTVQQPSQSSAPAQPSSTENQTNTTSANTTSNQTNTTQTGTTLNHIIINEFTTRGTNGSYDEFVELYNPTDSDMDITGWKLQYKSAAGDTWQSKVGSGLTGMIRSKSFFLLASKSYSLTTVPNYLHSANWGFADTGGHLRIINANATAVDKVGWGDANEPEGSASLPLEEGKSLERKSFTDTDNNANDFILATPSPRNSTNQ